METINPQIGDVGRLKMSATAENTKVIWIEENVTVTHIIGDIIIGINPSGDPIAFKKDTLFENRRTVTLDNIVLGELICDSNGELFQVAGIPMSPGRKITLRSNKAAIRTFHRNFEEVYRPLSEDIEEMLVLQGKEF